LSATVPQKLTALKKKEIKIINLSLFICPLIFYFLPMAATCELNPMDGDITIK
jgi:hypothetical protein